MQKRDYFIAAMNAECYRYKRWVIEAFSVTAQDTNPRPYPYALSRDNEGYYFTQASGEKTYLDDAPKGAKTLEAAFTFIDTLTVGPKDIPNLTKPVETTYGQLFVNFLCLVYAFGPKVAYQNGPITVKRMEKIIERRLVDNPPPGKARNEHDLYIDEYKKFNEAVGSLVGFTQLCVPSATPKSLVTDPAIRKRRNELLKQHKDELDDPVVQARIEAELIQMDKEWLKDDPASRFLIKEKNYAIARKKMFIDQGEEKGFGTSQGMITTSLDEGWDINKLPAMASSLREGSFSRGALTALGGEATKFNYRIFQNTVIAEEDCGSKLGLKLVIPKEDSESYLSSSVIEKDGKVVELTEDNILKYVDKPVTLRSPAFCKTKHQNFCAVCMGKKIAAHPEALSSYAASVGSTFLTCFLKRMHGMSLKTATLDLDNALS